MCLRGKLQLLISPHFVMVSTDRRWFEPKSEDRISGSVKPSVLSTSKFSCVIIIMLAEKYVQGLACVVGQWGTEVVVSQWCNGKEEGRSFVRYRLITWGGREGLIWYVFFLVPSLYVEKKTNWMTLNGLLNLWSALHISGTYMPIVRSSRLYLGYKMWCVVPKLLVVGRQVQGSRLCV
jgi:hypothetical protein